MICSISLGVNVSNCVIFTSALFWVHRAMQADGCCVWFIYPVFLLKMCLWLSTCRLSVCVDDFLYLSVYSNRKLPHLVSDSVLSSLKWYYVTVNVLVYCLPYQASLCVNNNDWMMGTPTQCCCSLIFTPSSASLHIFLVSYLETSRAAVKNAGPAALWCDLCGAKLKRGTILIALHFDNNYTVYVQKIQVLVQYYLLTQTGQIPRHIPSAAH